MKKVKCLSKDFEAGVFSIGVAALLVCGVVGGVAFQFMMNNQDDVGVDVEVEQWHTVWEGPVPVGEADPGEDASGFLSIFCLDYGETPDSGVLANNATDWENEATVYAYADADNFEEDLKHGDPIYFVVRARFTDTHGKDAGTWTYDDMRCSLEISGDAGSNNWTDIPADGGGDDAAYVNLTSDGYTGAGANVTAHDDNMCYINFWFDDNNDGYEMTENGQIDVVWIKLEAKY